MFNKNAYLIPQVNSSSLHPHFDVNGVEILLHHHHHHHHDVFSGHYLAANAPIIGAPALINPDNVRLQPDVYGTGNAAGVPRKQTVNKDRHSKIYTAQGPRDRRVRLSIGIARKFFDLQEMLGFDKPSKTLDWLLTKSKAAIKDLVQSKQKASESTPSPSECELLSSEDGDDSKKKNRGKEKDEQHTTSYLAKESRVKARARARERTKEKMCIKQLNSSNNGCNSYNVSCSNENVRFHDESVVIERKTKSPSFFGFQPNGIVSRDLSSNYIIPSANATENWDVCNFTSQSNLYAILDHHKFINR
ncbi:hypothetical protein ACS0TY_028599 [Phlomoides rotata]